jgi:ankyrin repeat protein
LLLSKGAQVHKRDLYENFPLKVALANNEYDVVTTLLLFGADINFKGARGYTVLHHACEDPQLTKLQFLLDNYGGSASPSILNFNAKNRNDETPLMVALLNPDHLKLILDYIIQVQFGFNILNC